MRRSSFIYVWFLLIAGSFDARAQLLAPRAVLDQYCVTCHNEKLKTAGLMLDKADVEHPAASAEIWEKVLRKLRAGEMPPAGRPRPDAASYTALSAFLEKTLDEAAASNPHP